MKSSVIFDMDGTVIDSMQMYKDIRIEILEDMGITLSEKEREILDGVSQWEIPRILNDIRDEQIDEEYFVHIINTRLRDNYRQGFPLKKGVENFLDYLDDKGIKYCIATASKNIQATSVFTKLGMLDRFEFVITTSDVARSKRFPTIYKEAAIMMGTTFEDTFVFEDALYAVNTAKDAGFKVVGIADDYFTKSRDEIISKADYFIEDYDDLMQQIEAGKIVFD